MPVNAHFGQSLQFAIYKMPRSGAVELLEIRRIPTDSGQDEHGKIAARIAAGEDCALVFLRQIGASAAARVTRKKIMPVKVPGGSSIEGQRRRLQEMLRGTPPLWLAKIFNEEEALEEGEKQNGRAGR
ncbi:nitrogen fixation protein NifX [Clostridium perfringens]